MKKYYKDRETQGHKKMFQHIEDLKRNKHFLRDWRRYKKFSKTCLEDSSGNCFMFLVEEYEKLNKITKKFIKKYQHNWEKIVKKMAEEYGLDINLLTYIDFSLDKRLSEDNHLDDYLDMCVYNDDNDELLGYTTLPDLPLILNPARKNHLRAYPIRIDIHKFASKRDVLDFIEKRWERIYTNLSHHTDRKVRFRERKLARKMVDFMWDNKHLKTKEIKMLLDKKFPDNHLVYYQIDKIISIEKARRYEWIE